MNNLKKLKDDELESNLQGLLRQEKVLLHELLQHIREVDERKLYLRRARPSLFDYLVKDCGYAAASAQRRIDAARLSRQIPEVLEKIEAGQLTLSHVSILQKGIRQRSKVAEVSVEKKREILGKLEGVPYDQTEKIVAQNLDLEVLEKTSVKTQADESRRISITLSKESWEKLSQCRDVLGHRVPDGAYPEVIAIALQFFLDRQKAFLKSEAAISTSGPEVTLHQKEGVGVSPAVRRHILRRDKCCQFKDPKTGRLCASRFRLEVDHIKMRCQGGRNDLKNLRALCASHNKLMAEDALGGMRRRGASPRKSSTVDSH